MEKLSTALLSSWTTIPTAAGRRSGLPVATLGIRRFDTLEDLIDLLDEIGIPSGHRQSWRP